MLGPDDAQDILLNAQALEDWALAHNMELSVARRELWKVAEHASGESRLVRMARAAHEQRGRLFAGRTDVQQLVSFVERAPRLPGRVKQVFMCCIVEGMSHAECARHLGIAPGTVRVHLRRLRRTMRAVEHREEVLHGNYPGSWGEDLPSRSRNPG